MTRIDKSPEQLDAEAVEPSLRWLITEIRGDA